MVALLTTNVKISLHVIDNQTEVHFKIFSSALIYLYPQLQDQIVFQLVILFLSLHHAIIHYLKTKSSKFKEQK